MAPVLLAIVGDMPPETPRLSELASQYTGVEPDSAFDSCFTDTGWIGRVRLTGGTCYAQAVNPSSSPAWGTWTTLDAAAGNWAGTQQCAIMGMQDGSGVMYAFWVEANGHAVSWARWNGSTWGAAQAVTDRGAGFLVSGLACDGIDPTIRLY